VLKIRDAIVSFHDKLVGAFPMHDYVLDVVVVLPSYSCQLIEINPFGENMSSGRPSFSSSSSFILLFCPFLSLSMFLSRFCTALAYQEVLCSTGRPIVRYSMAPLLASTLSSASSNTSHSIKLSNHDQRRAQR
jgi:hypothetical protein